MTVYFDGVRLAGTSIKELHRVAKDNSLEVGWFRGKANPQHYQVPPTIIGSILADGRVYLVSRNDLLELTGEPEGR